MTPQIALSKSQYDSIHELLDISLTVDPKLATVFFHHAAHVGVIYMDIHAGGWVSECSPDAQVWMVLNDENSIREGREKLRAYLSPENIAAVAAQRRSNKADALRKQLAELEAK